MVRYFVEEVQVQHRTLSHAALQMSQYQHYFTTFTPSARAASSGSGNDDRRSSQADQDRARERLRRQAVADNEPIFQRPRLEDRRDGRKGGGGGKGNGQRRDDRRRR